MRVFSCCEYGTTISRQTSYYIEIKCCKTVDLGMIHEREREQERTEDALASRDEEGRGKLRKVAGICKQELIREYPNGATHWLEGPVHQLW